MVTERFYNWVASRSPGALSVFALLLALPYVIAKSLWVDEFGSYWVISGTLGEAINRSLLVQGQTPLYYVVMWVWVQLFGVTELALRVPSLLCFCALPWLVFSLVREIRSFSDVPSTGELRVDNGVGFVSVVSALLVLANADSYSIILSARPYSFAVVCSISGVTQLLSWLRTGRGPHWWLALGFTILSAYFHFLFASTVLVQLALWLLFRDQGRPDACWKGMATFVLGVSLSIVPWIPTLNKIEGSRKFSSFLPSPDIFAISELLIPASVVLILGVAWLCAIANRIFTGSRNVYFDPVGLTSPLSAAAMIALVPPIAVLALSFIRGLSLFLPRYFLIGAIGSAVAAGFVLRCFVSRGLRVFVVVALLCMGVVGSLYSAVFVDVEDWRGSLAVIKAEDPEARCGMAIFAGFVEAQDVSWLADERKMELFLSPIRYYLPGRSVVAMPYSFDLDDAKHYLNDALLPELTRSDCAYIVALNHKIFPNGETYQPSWGELVSTLGELGYDVVRASPQDSVWHVRLNRARVWP